MKARRDTISELVEHNLKKCSLNENIFGIGASPQRMRQVLAQRRAVAARLGTGKPGYGNVPSPAYDPVARRREFIPASFKLGFMLARDPVASADPRRVGSLYGAVNFPDIIRQAMENNPNIRHGEIERLSNLASPALNPDAPGKVRRALARRAAALSTFRVPATTPTVTSGTLGATPRNVPPPIIYDLPSRAQVIAGAATRKYIYDPLTRTLPGLIFRKASPREMINTRRRFFGAVPFLGAHIAGYGAAEAASRLTSGLGMLGGAGTRSVGLQGLGPGEPASDAGGDRFSGSQLYRGG